MATIRFGSTSITPAVVKGVASGVVLPDQAGNAGKFLHTDGENLSWENAVKNNADVLKALAVGYDTRAESFASTSIGAGAVAESEYGVAMGYGAWVTSDRDDGKNILTRYSTALGYSATVTKPNSVALVSDGGVYASQGVAIGYGASTRTADSISIGNSASTGTDIPSENIAGAIAIGKNAKAKVAYSIAIGNNANANADDNTEGQMEQNSIAIGDNVASTAEKAISLGASTSAKAKSALAVGTNAVAAGPDSIVIGTNALSNSSQGANVVIGPDSKISGYSFNSTAVGIGAQAQNYDATAIGRNVSAGAQYSFAAGYAAQTNPVYCNDTIDSSQPVVAVGFGAVSRSNGTIAIGQDVYADGPYSIVIGQNSTVADGNKYGIAIGNNARGVSESIAIGYITSGSMNSVTIGSRANCGSSTGVSIGYASQANSDGLESIAIGGYAATNKSHAIALGYSTKATSENAIAIGKKAEAKTSHAVAIGGEAKVGGDEGIAVGHSSVSARHGIALGTRANANDFGTVSIGLNSESTITNAVAIGNQSYARGQDSVALGSSAVVKEGASFAVQLGVGTNYDANTLQFKDYKLLYENGVIPYSRFTDINSPSNGQTLVYDENEDMLVWSDAAGGISEVNWGDITGNISDQEDLNDKFDDIRSNFQDINENIQSLDIDMSTNYQNLNNKVDDAIQTLEQDFSTSTRRLESNIRDAEGRLQTQIDTLSSIGQFLAIWDCDTGIARYLNEGFEYQTGNYFIIGTIAEGEGAVNYMPDGNMYPGKVEATEEDIKVSDMWFYDGEHWIYLANHERAIAVDAELDSESSNPVENKAITKHLGEFELVLDDRFDDIRNSIDETNSHVEELENRPIPIAVPQLASVDVLQVKTQAEKAARLPKEEWMGEYSDIIVTLNLTKEQILERMYDLYVTVSRFKTNKNTSYTEYSEDGEQDIRYRNVSKFSVMNDLRQKTDERLYCWRFVTDSSYHETDPRRYCYFYTKDNFNDSVDALWEEDPNIGLWSSYGSAAGIATCFNAVVWYEHGYRAQMFYDDYFENGSIERYEEGDIDSFANVSNSLHYPEYNISNYVTKMECRKYTKDGQNYFFWAEKDEWENGGCGSCVGGYLAPVPNGIPKYMETLVSAFDEVRQLEENGFVFVEKRPDLNYKRVEDFEALLEALQKLTFREKYVDNDGRPTYWNCYWFDYPVMPVLLKDCEVRTHGGDSYWIKLEDLVKEGATDKLRDDLPLELKLPYNTYYLWMRFCSLQKRCAYGSYSNWLQDEGRSTDNPMWPYQKHDLKHGVSDYNVLGRRAFARPRQSYKGSGYGKISEYILFNVCSPLDAASGSKSKSTPIQKKLNIDYHAKTGLRD